MIVQTLTPIEPAEPAIDEQLTRAWERRNRAIGTGYFKYQDSFVAYDQVKPLTVALWVGRRPPVQQESAPFIPAAALTPARVGLGGV